MVGRKGDKPQRGVNLNKKKKKTRRGKKHHRPVNVERIRREMHVTSLDQITLPMFQNMCNLHNQARDILDDRRGEVVKMKEDMIRFEQKLGSVTMAFNDAANKLKASRAYFVKLHAYCRKVTDPKFHGKLDEYWTEFQESGLLDGYDFPELKPFELSIIKGKKPRQGTKIINLPPMSPAPEQPPFMETDSLWNPSEVMRPPGPEPLAQLTPMVLETQVKEVPRVPQTSTSTAPRGPKQATSTSIMKERFQELVAQEEAKKPDPPPERFRDWTMLVAETHKKEVRRERPFEWEFQRHIIARNYSKAQMMFWKADNIDRAVRKNKAMKPLTEKEEKLTDDFEDAITDAHLGGVGEDWFLQPDLGTPSDPKVLEHRILVTWLHFLSKDTITKSGRRVLKEDADQEQRERDELIRESSDESSTGEIVEEEKMLDETLEGDKLLDQASDKASTG